MDRHPSHSLSSATPEVDTTPKLAISTDEGQLMTIGAMAQLSGVTVRTLRYYEEMDLIGPVKRSSGKYRLYNDRSLKRIQAIQALQGLHYSLEEILEVLGPYSQSLGFNKCERIQATRQTVERQQAFIEDKMRALSRLKQDLEASLEVINSVCENCYQQTPQENCSDTCDHRNVHLS